MRITRADVIVTSPSRNFVTLKITTDDGLTGLGDATLNGRELAVAAYLRDHVVSLLIGRDPAQIEDIWQFLYRSAYWRRGPVTMAAIAAVDMALWDIKGKVANLPLYQLLGGACRTGLRAYGHASGATLAELFDSIREHLAEGTARSACRRLCPVSEPCTASPPAHSPQESDTTTIPPSADRSQPRRYGTPPPTSGTCRRSSKPSAASSAPSCHCCMTGTTG